MNKENNDLIDFLLEEGFNIFVLCFSITKCGSLWYDRQKIKKQINTINPIQNKSLQDVINEVKQNKKSKLYFIDGILQPNDFNNKYNTILAITQKQPLYSRDSFYEPTLKLNFKDISKYKDIIIDYEYTFKFRDKNQNISVDVTLNNNTDIQSALQFIQLKDERMPITLWNRFLNFCWLILVTSTPTGIAEYLLRDKTFKGIHLGWRNSTFGIKASGMLSILGEVVYDSKTKSFNILNPISLTISKKTMISKLQSQLNTDQSSFLFWMTISFLSGMYFTRRIILFNRKYPKYYIIIQNKIKQLLQKIKIY